MLKEVVNKDNKKIICLTFDSIEDILNYIETTPHNSNYWGPNVNELSSRKRDNHKINFSGTKSLEEAIELCRFSRFDEMEELFNINEQLKFNVPNYLNKRKTELGVYGFRPDIPKRIMGHPKQMHRIVRDESKKFINIYFNVGAACVVAKEAIYNKGIISLKMINLLESLDYRVNFNFFELSHEHDEYLLIKINIKRFSEKLDPNICYFPICHPSFLRRLLFAVCETIEFKYGAWTDSYGKVLEYEEIKEILNIQDSDILINSVNDLGVCGHDLLEDTRNYFERTDLNKYLGNNGSINFDEKNKTFSLNMNMRKR